MSFYLLVPDEPFMGNVNIAACPSWQQEGSPALFMSAIEGKVGSQYLRYA